MSLHDHIQLMTAYNARLNRQVYAAAARLPVPRFSENLGAFFGSLQGTLNHIVVADLIWLRRFHAGFPQFSSLEALAAFPAPRALDQIVHAALDELWTARQRLDALLSHWARHELSAAELAQDLRYTNMKGVASSRNFAEVILHLLNHQTHHRGQATTLLYQQGQDVGITDFLVDIPDHEAP